MDGFAFLCNAMGIYIVFMSISVPLASRVSDHINQ
jgi:hypothetical protein